MDQYIRDSEISQMWQERESVVAASNHGRRFDDDGPECGVGCGSCILRYSASIPSYMVLHVEWKLAAPPGFRESRPVSDLKYGELRTLLAFVASCSPGQ